MDRSRTASAVEGEQSSVYKVPSRPDRLRLARAGRLTPLGCLCGLVRSSLSSRVGRDLPNRLLLALLVELLVSLLLLFWMAVTIT